MLSQALHARETRRQECEVSIQLVCVAPLVALAEIKLQMRGEHIVAVNRFASAIHRHLQAGTKVPDHVLAPVEPIEDFSAEFLLPHELDDVAIGKESWNRRYG